MSKKYKLKLTLNTGEVITSNAIEIPPSITGMEFEEQVPPGFNVTITVANSRNSGAWRFIKVYDIKDVDPWDSGYDDHLIGQFTSPEGTITVQTTTGLVNIEFSSQGALYISNWPTITGGLTLSSSVMENPRYDVTSDGTITFDGIIDWDD